MHKTALKSSRLQFGIGSVSMGAVIHGSGLLAGHLVAKQWEEPMAKLAIYAAFTVGAGFVCKLLHERMTRKEQSF
jgi:hypothetical protein